MAESVVYYTDLGTGVTYGTLPVSSWQYTEILSAPGSFQTVIPCTGDAVADIAPSALSDGRTGIWIERAGSVLFGGILWTQQVAPDGNTITLGGEGFGSCWDKRAIHETLVFTGVEQTDLASQVITYLQGKPYGDIGITVPGSFTATQSLDRTYNDYEHRLARDVLDEFSTLEGGFDYRYRPYRDMAGRLRVAYMPLYPTTGRETEFRFVLGSNCRAFSSASNGKDIATQVTAVGAGNGTATPSATAQAATLAQGWPLLESVDSYTDTSDLSILQSKANLHARVNAKSTQIPSIAVSPDADPPLGSYSVGDVVTVVGRYGLLQLNGRYKITEISPSQDATQGEVVALTIAPQEVFA